MGRYLIVSRRTDSPDAARRSAELQNRAQAEGFSVQPLSRMAWIATAGPRPPKAVIAGNWVLVGDVLNRRNRVLDPHTDVEPFSYEKKLLARFWGRFAGVRLMGSGVVDAAIREPSGALECITWQDPDLIYVASEFPAWLVQSLSPPWRINFTRVGQALRDPSRVWGELLLDGPCAVLPGTVLTLPAETTPTPLWRPVQFAQRTSFHRLDIEQSASLLAEVIDETVSGYASLASRLACEISGGLDSSVVAASVIRSGRDKVRIWLNAYGEDPGSDERPYVRDLAVKLGIVPVTVPRAKGVITEDGLRRISQGLRPGLNALDWSHDDDWAARFTSLDIEAVMTGKGGDSVTIQAVTSDVFTEQFRAAGWRSILSPDLPRIARLNERSIWSLIGEAWRPALANSRTASSQTFAAPEGDANADLHPWLEGMADIGPAKAYQVAGIVNGVSFSAPSGQTAVVDLFHPLLAQPVVEACLSLSASQLTYGARDRGLVRRAFADRLPASILERRSKGDMTAFYGRMIAANLAVLRPWLLDGRLAAEGLIDRDEVAPRLSADSLIWKGGYSEIMVAAAMEGWVRTWEARLSSPPRGSASSPTS
jgi:asparagine synthase (glutamine-hydrolysing)